VRGTWSRLRFVEGIIVNRKKVHRLMKIKSWTLPKRLAGHRPRVAASHSVAEKPDRHWATDLALVNCGRDGWCVFVPVINCCTREILGHALKRTGRAKTVERALEEALLNRFGTLRSAPPGMLLRHDNGLVFGSHQYRAVVKDYGLKQEYISPYTPQQNGLCERFIKTFKEDSAGATASHPSNTPSSNSGHGSDTTTPADPTNPSATSPQTNTTKSSAIRQPE
jgi:putative transposase